MSAYCGGSLCSSVAFIQLAEVACQMRDPFDQVGSGKRAYNNAKEAVKQWKHMDLGWVATNKPFIEVMLATAAQEEHQLLQVCSGLNVDFARLLLAHCCCSAPFRCVAYYSIPSNVSAFCVRLHADLSLYGVQGSQCPQFSLA